MVANVPSRRRVTKPTPFSRPSIEIGGTGPKRVWRNVAACDLQEGDTVSGAGTLTTVHQRSEMVVVRNVEGRAEAFYRDQSVYAFVKESP